MLKARGQQESDPIFDPEDIFHLLGRNGTRIIGMYIFVIVRLPYFPFPILTLKKNKPCLQIMFL